MARSFESTGSTARGVAPPSDSVSYGGAVGRRAASPSTTYERLMEVNATGTDGAPVVLALQLRTSPAVSPRPWFTVSWRTRLRPGGPNRRFYRYHAEPWSIDAHLARDLLLELEGRGGLDYQFHDGVRRSAASSVHSSESTRPPRCCSTTRTYVTCTGGCSPTSGTGRGSHRVAFDGDGVSRRRSARGGRRR